MSETKATSPLLIVAAWLIVGIPAGWGVYNTALNAWSALPPHDYAPLIAKYGDRFQMQDLNQVMPIPSGLLGGVRLVTDSPAK